MINPEKNSQELKYKIVRNELQETYDPNTYNGKRGLTVEQAKQYMETHKA